MKNQEIKDILLDIGQQHITPTEGYKLLMDKLSRMEQELQDKQTEFVAEFIERESKYRKAVEGVTEELLLFDVAFNKDHPETKQWFVQGIRHTLDYIKTLSNLVSPGRDAR